jgi:hypothetical protein
MTISKVLISAASLGAALWIPGALAADPPGALPGDAALTCEQIYAQGTAETQREQQERARKNDEMRAQTRATGALVAGAMLTGGVGGTGQVAQAAAEAQADRQMAMLSAPPPSNPRMAHLKQLWAQKHCVMKK